MPSISRTDLISAVEYAFPPNLPHEERDALRRVARTTSRVARGNWFVDGCGCPATQAGLATKNECDTPEPVREFGIYFDDETRRIHSDIAVLEVID